MISLTIDVGNTKIKAGVFNEDVLDEIFVFEKKEVHSIKNIIKKNNITHSILSNVGNENDEIESFLSEQTQFLKLNRQTKLPFHNNYKSPETLGMDRVSAVAGSLHFFSNTNCLIIDAGTCITYDFISSDKNYFGGAIAPGLQMRLNAMHQFTKKLPQLSFSEIDDFVGNTTETSMLSGAFYGMLNEINETISRYEQQYGTLQVITCGGDSILFDKHIKRSIFAAPYLVLYGLNKILSFNVK
jgi:type III pantothenate kinase